MGYLSIMRPIAFSQPKHNQPATVFLIFIVVQFLAQNCLGMFSVNDSLISLLQTELTDTLKVDVLNDLAWELKRSDHERAEQYARSGLKLANSIGDINRQATSLNRIGEIYRLLSNYDKAAKYFEQALKLERAIDHKFGIARAQSMLSTVYKNQGRLKKSIESGKESLLLFLQIDRKSSAARTHQRLASIYLQSGILDSALLQLEEKLILDQKLEDSSLIANTFWSMGNVYFEMGNPEKALEYYLDSKDIWIGLSREDKVIQLLTNLANVYMELGQIPKSISAHEASIAFFENIGEPDLAADNYLNLGVLEILNGNLEQAKKMVLEALHRKERSNIGQDLDLGWYNLGLIHQKMGHLDSAEVQFLQVLEHSKSQPVLMDTYWLLSEVYYTLGAYEQANQYRKEYGFIRDEMDRSMEESIRLKDKIEQVRQDQIVLQKNNEIQLSKLQKRNQLVFFLVLVIVLLSVLFFFALQFHKTRKNAIIYEQKVDDLIKGQEIKKLGAELEGRDEERKRIAKELHDRLGGMLSMVKLHFKTVEDQIQDLQHRNKIQYQKANQLLDEACEEVRKISHDMISGVLYKFGLIQALQSLSDSINQTGQLEVEFIPSGVDKSFGDECEIHLYRIVQELLSNVLKHAKASEVTIQLIQTKQNLRLEVADNGVGFEPPEKLQTGIGLKNVEARVDSLEGELKINSNNSGTIVNIEMPIKDLDL